MKLLTCFINFSFEKNRSALDIITGTVKSIMHAFQTPGTWMTRRYLTANSGQLLENVRVHWRCVLAGFYWNLFLTEKYFLFTHQFGTPCSLGGLAAPVVVTALVVGLLSRVLVHYICGRNKWKYALRCSNITPNMVPLVNGRFNFLINIG